MSEFKLNLQEFDINQIDKNRNMIIIGKKGTGKSSLVLDYLYHKREVSNILVISPTDKYNQNYRNHLPEISIHDEYSPELIKTFLNKQIELTKQSRDDQNIDPRGILILDDCMFDAKSWTTDRSIQWIFMNGGFANITMIITISYAMGLSPKLRANANYIFICREPKLSNRKKLYEQYCGMFPSFEIFNQVLMATTNNYGCLVIDNTSISDKLENQAFWYKADLHGDFTCKISTESSKTPTCLSNVKETIIYILDKFMLHFY